MFERIRNAFRSGGPQVATTAGIRNADVVRWAAQQRLAIVPQAVDGHFDLGGDLQGHPWRLECGLPSRDYVQGFEFRGRADIVADADAAVMVLNRSLLEVLEGKAYDAITDTLQTTVNTNLPEEIRWLAMYEEVSWPGLPASFRQHFAVVTDDANTAQRWVQAPMVSQLLDIAESEDGGRARVASPVVLMLMRGKVYLRMEHTRRSLAEVAYATHALLVSAQSALHNLPPLATAAPECLSEEAGLGDLAGNDQQAAARTIPGSP